MNSEKIHFVIDFAISEGRFEDFEATVRLMTERTSTEPGALTYEWFLTDDQRRCRLLETYADARAVWQHLSGTVVQELVPKLLAFSKMSRFEVYGVPDTQSAAALKSAGAEIFRHWRGLSS
jgi:quinol monooxygenase YgiN